MDSNVPGATRVRKRAPEACTFCRRRKIKCSTERPICANCKTHGMSCSYEPIDVSIRAQPRPAKRARKEIGLAESRVEVVTPADTTCNVDASAQLTPESTQRGSSVSRIVVSSNGVPSYHGRTSTLFEESYNDRPSPGTTTKVPEEWVEKGLICEAARQRQLEDVNYRLGKLDFDGVEPELGLHLLSLHWNRQHHAFLITYRPAFMRDMACNGPYFSRLLLNAIFFGASKFSPRRELRRDANDVRTAGWRFRDRVSELLGGALNKSDITTIQALLMMTNSLFALGDERSAAWLYAGLAFRMIVDLGIHVDRSDLSSQRKFTDEDFEIRRRVFWAAFVVDKIQSLYQGRPVTIKESDTLVPIKFLDTYEELEHWTPLAYLTSSSTNYPGCSAYSISTFRHLCKLSIILSDILSSIYTERSSHSSPAELSHKLEDIHGRLQRWRDELPDHLGGDLNTMTATPAPHVLSLLAMYHVLIILLHHPFVADGHLFNTARSISINSLLCCATAANDIVQLVRVFDHAFSIRRAPYLISLGTCLAVFRENQETNPAVRRANALVQNLMKRLRLSLDNFNECQIHRAMASNSEQTSPNTNRNTTTEHRLRLHSLDLDGIIQSFVREQDHQIATQVNVSENPNVPRLATPVQLQPLAPQSQENNSMNFDYNDLYYGFNSAALDGFSITPYYE
ncbi:hypothetical protein ACN47E_003791 [Coniothyrium glycines]